MTHSNYEHLRTWFSELPLGDRLRTMSSACCSNPNPTMGEDVVTWRPVAVCGNCGAWT